MIFVTVGMHNQGFDRLIARCDLLAEQTEEEMIMQRGSTDYIPKNAESFDFASYEEILRLIKLSRIVITHDGAGSILNCLLNEKVTIVVPRLKAFNECKYENKLDLALELQKLGKIYLVEDINSLNLDLIQGINPFKNIRSTNNLVNNIKKYITD